MYTHVKLLNGEHANENRPKEIFLPARNVPSDPTLDGKFEREFELK